MNASNTSQSQDWSSWAQNRIDELVQNAITVQDEDFEVPDDMAVKQAKEFVSQFISELDVSKIGKPSIWLSQNGDFVFQWRRKGAELEFKFTPDETIVFVSNEQETWSEKQPHSVHESQKLHKAVDRYLAA